LHNPGQKQENPAPSRRKEKGEGECLEGGALGQDSPTLASSFIMEYIKVI